MSAELPHKSHLLGTHVSVVIPLFNGAPYIERAVRSVLSQTFKDFEIVVIDDGSTDGGGEIALHISDPRLRLIRQENMGVSAARNRGIAETSGENIAFLDADDEWDSDFLSAIIKLLARFPEAGLFGTGYRMVYPRGNLVEVTVEEALTENLALLISDYFRRASGGAPVHASGVVIPRRVFHELGGFKVGRNHGEDLEMWARIALRYPLAYDSRIMFSFHQTPREGKPRFMNSFSEDPKIELLVHTLQERGINLKSSHNAISSHLRAHIRASCFWHFRFSGRKQTVRFLIKCPLTRFVQLLKPAILGQTPWALFRLWGMAFAALKSRHLMRFTQRRRRSHGILHRLTA